MAVSGLTVNCYSISLVLFYQSGVGGLFTQPVWEHAW